ncbi:MAG: hypothetical protein HQM09_06765 [Candidatus Riflebacteria bacterium]|nr:hypothetical protein [Candidatus Riflebacteria bacterium]
MTFSLWEALHDMFDTDDGSYPEILISRLNGAEIIKGYSLIREKSKFLVGSPCFTNRHDGREKKIDSVPNAAEVVVSGAAEPFHFLVRHITTDEGIVPELGVFVFDNAIALDYQPGKQWNASALAGFFHLMSSLVRCGEKAIVTHEESIPPLARQRFDIAFSRYLREMAVHD